MTPHKHAELIKAWADGATIQIKHHESGGWIDTDSPQWGDLLYRVKPEVVYPTTQIEPGKLYQLYQGKQSGCVDSLLFVVNLAIKHAIDSGQVYIKETK